jgi:hypothetical protein
MWTATAVRMLRHCLALCLSSCICLRCVASGQRSLGLGERGRVAWHRPLEGARKTLSSESRSMICETGSSTVNRAKVLRSSSDPNWRRRTASPDSSKVCREVKMPFKHKTRLHQSFPRVCLLSIEFYPWQCSIRAGFIFRVRGIALRGLCALWLNGQTQTEVGMASVEKLR